MSDQTIVRAPRGPKADAIDPAVFITVWQSSKTLAEVAERLNRGVKAVSHKAGQFRKKGVKLQNFRRGPGGFGKRDWESLAKLAEEAAQA